MVSQYGFSLSKVPGLFRRKQNWPFTILVAVGVSVGYTILTLAYTLLPMVEVPALYSIWRNTGILLLLSFGTVGFPVALFSRYRLVSPLAFLLVVALFWHVLVRMTPSDLLSEAGPAFLFTLLLAPLYIIVYAWLAAVEHWVRFR